MSYDEGVYTCNLVADALLRVAARTKEDEGDEILEMKELSLMTAWVHLHDDEVADRGLRPSVVSSV